MAVFHHFQRWRAAFIDFIINNQTLVQMVRANVHNNNNMTTLPISPKALQQDPTGRGRLNGHSKRLSNHTGEVTWNVTLGISDGFYYTWLDMLKFATKDDAIAYVTGLGATVGSVKNRASLTLCKQDGCAFSDFYYHSIKD